MVSSMTKYNVHRDCELFVVGLIFIKKNAIVRPQ